MGIPRRAPHPQRRSVQRWFQQGHHRARDRARIARDHLPPLAALSPPDLRQDRTLASDTQTPSRETTRSRSINELQTQIDRFVEIYNHERPHRARGRITPAEAFTARDRARPGSPTAPTHFRVRTDRVDKSGKVTLRHNSKLLHIGIGRRHAGAPIRLYVADLDVRIMTTDGEILRHLTLDPDRRYQGLNREAH